MAQGSFPCDNAILKKPFQGCEKLGDVDVTGINIQKSFFSAVVTKQFSSWWRYDKLKS